MNMRICGGGGGGPDGHTILNKPAKNGRNNYKKRISADLTAEEKKEMEIAIDTFNPLRAGFTDPVEDANPKELLEYFRSMMSIVNKIGDLKFDSTETDKKEFIELVEALNSTKESNEKYCDLFDLECSEFRVGVTQHLYFTCQVDLRSYLHECNVWI